MSHLTPVSNGFRLPLRDAATQVATVRRGAYKPAHSPFRRTLEPTLFGDS
jgi:hypothetical protein